MIIFDFTPERFFDLEFWLKFYGNFYFKDLIGLGENSDEIKENKMSRIRTTKGSIYFLVFSICYPFSKTCTRNIKTIFFFGLFVYL